MIRCLWGRPPGLRPTPRSAFSNPSAPHLAAAMLLCGTIAAAAVPGLQYDQTSRRYTLEGPVALKNVRLGLELNGAMRWASEADRAAWKQNEATFQFGTKQWTVRFRPTGEAWLISS